MNSLTVRATCLALAIGGVTCGVLPGCTEDQPPAQSPASRREMIAAAIYIRSSNEPEAAKLADTLASALTRASYRVVSSADAEHELVAELRVALRETKGILQIYVNGQPKKAYAAVATLHVIGGSVLLGAESVEYDVSDGPSEEQVRTLVATATGPAVRRYLAQHRLTQREETVLRQQREEDAVSAREEEQLAARKDRRRQEDTSWSQVVLSECTAAMQPTGCDRVKQYLAEYPTGRHNAEAKKALEAGTPLIAKLADESDWQASRVAECRAASTAADCEAVREYMERQPVGIHVEEARVALAEAEKRIRRLEAARAEEGRKREQEQRAAQQRRQCHSDCLAKRCVGMKPSSFEQCEARCEEGCS